MRIRTFLAGLTVAGVLAVPAVAHHSFAMFDQNKMVTWTGTVQEFKWTNPHSHIKVLVPAGGKDKSLAGVWDLEGGSPNIMARQGWKKNSFKAGDKITVVGHPLRDGSKGGSLYYAMGADGQKLYHDVNRSGGPAGKAY